MLECTILAGPNGSGKSSIHRKLDPPGIFINADELAKALPADMLSGPRRIRAGRLAIEQIDTAIDLRTDFCFETTLSSKHSLNVMQRARQAGFRVGLVYVILATPELHVERVRFRVKDGGHDIPETDIVRRHDASLANLPLALRMAHEYVIIDNSEAEPIFVFEARPHQYLDALSCNMDVPLHRKLLEIVKSCTPLR